MSLKLPNAADVIRTLEMMIGQNPILGEGGEAIDLTNPPRSTFVSWLKTEDGSVLGAIVTSLPAAVFLGGTMIMIPVGGQEDQVTSGEASEATVDAMDEINNMMRGLLNKVHENTHVTPSDIAIYETPADGDENAWILDPAERLDLGGALPYGTGHMTLLSRVAG